MKAIFHQGATRRIHAVDEESQHSSTPSRHQRRLAPYWLSQLTNPVDALDVGAGNNHEDIPTGMEAGNLDRW